MPAVQPFRSACFFSVDNGATVQLRPSAASEALHALPANVTNLFRFDEDPSATNNQGLVAAWNANSQLFTMSGSTVLKNGQPATFDPPGLLFIALQNASALYVKASATSDAFTRDEQAQLLALSFRGAGLI